jgi:predicted HTH domain antitoxin
MSSRIQNMVFYPEQESPMVTQELFKTIASEIQIFPKVEQKETFLFVLGALTSKIISLQKAAEIMDMEPEFLLELLALMGITFSYLTEEDIGIEQTW